MEDKESNLNVNPKHKASILKSEPCSNKNIFTFRDFLSFFKGTDGDALIPKQSGHSFRVTDTHLNARATNRCGYSGANMGKGIK